MAEIHPLLMAILIMLPNRQRWSLYSVDVYEMGSGDPLGYFDIASEPTTPRACGYFNAIGSSVVMRRPIWFQSHGSENDVVQPFYELVREAGHVD